MPDAGSVFFINKMDIREVYRERKKNFVEMRNSEEGRKSISMGYSRGSPFAPSLSKFLEPSANYSKGTGPLSISQTPWVSFRKLCNLVK